MVTTTKRLALMLLASLTALMASVTALQYKSWAYGRSLAREPPARVPPALASAKVRGASKAQDGEDVFAFEHFFYGAQGVGSFLEMGALDGLMYSNTYAFEQVLGWKGVLIEASPKSFERLARNRPSQHTIHAAVCDSERMVHYLEHPMACCRGIAEFMSKGFRAKWFPTLSSEGGWHFPRQNHSGSASAVNRSIIHPVKCLPLSRLLGDEKMQHFDFFSLDVEGGELAVLRAIDFSSYSFDVIVVEADGHDVQREQEVIQLLRSKGYRFLAHVRRNDWFLHASFVPTRNPALPPLPHPNTTHASPLRPDDRTPIRGRMRGRWSTHRKLRRDP